MGGSGLSFRANRKLKTEIPAKLTTLGGTDNNRVGEASMLIAIVALAWALLFLRLICFRTTLSPRTIFTWMALGALLGTVAIPAAYKFFDYYRFTGSPLYVLLALILELLVMTLPVLAIIGRPSFRRASSICDAFLAAFSVGLGYELLSLILTAAQPETHDLRGVSFFLPGIVSTEQLTVAGFGYWCGFVAVIVAAAWRFLRRPVLVYTTAAAALILCALDMYGDLWQTPFAEQIRTFSRHGSLVPWLVFVCLVGSIFLEIRWLRTRLDLGELQAEFLNVGTAASRLRLRDADRAGLVYRLRRQSENLAGELQRDSNNHRLKQQSEAVAGLRESEKASGVRSPLPLRWRAWAQRRSLQLVALLAFFVLAGLLPDALGFGSLSKWLWQSQPLAGSFPPFGTNILATVVLLLLVWEYIQASPRPFSEVIVDEIAQFSAERRILQVGFGIVLLAVLYPQPNELIDFQSALAKTLNVRPGFQDGKTILLLLAWAITGLTVRRAELWRTAPSSERLQSLLHNLVTALSVGAVAWIVLALYIPAQVFAYAKWGTWAFDNFSSNGNSVLGMLLGLVSAAVSFLAAWLARLLAIRFERSFLEPGQTAADSRAAIVAAEQ